MDSIKTELNAYNIRDLSPKYCAQIKTYQYIRPKICGYVLLQSIIILLYYY